jgi:hypothetical protein
MVTPSPYALPADVPASIVFDLHLPEHDGLEVLSCDTAHASVGARSPLIVSGVAAPQTQQEIREYGADYMEKPNAPEGYRDLAVVRVQFWHGGASRLIRGAVQIRTL